MGTWRYFWMTVCIAFGAVGVFHAAGAVPVELLIVIILLSIFAGLTVLIERETSCRSGRWLRITATAFVLWLAILGLGLFLGPACFLLILAIAAVSPRAICSYNGIVRRQFGDSRSTEQLCLEWQSSYSDLQQAESPSERMRIIAARQRCLDELERRDPGGFNTWITSGARTDGNSHRFIPRERFNRGEP